MSAVPRHRKTLTSLLRTHQERSEPLAFAGRSEIIKEIIATARAHYKHPIRGATFLISGAPGAGKTSLVQQLLKEWDEQDYPTESLFTASVPDEREDVADLWEALTTKLTGRSREELFHTREKSKSGSTGVSHLIQATGTITNKVTSEGASVWSTRMLSNHLQNEAYAAPCIFAVDEIQGVRADTPMSSMLKNLHTQSEVPILLVCAGLANSRSRLDEADAISAGRMTEDNVIRIGALTLDAAREAAEGGLRKIAEVAEVDGGRLSEMFTEAFTTRSDQWPRHITCYLRGVAKALIEQDVPDLDSLDTERVLSLGDEERQNYYRDRVDSSGLPEHIIEILYSSVERRPLRAGEADGLLLKTIREDTSLEGEVLRKIFIENKASPFENVLHAGIVTLDRNSRCEIPIPSMRTYIKSRARKVEQVNQGISR